MKEETGPVMPAALVLCAVFVPTAVLGGITGRAYQEVALAMAVPTVISALNSLTLSPALCALLLKHKGEHGEGEKPARKFWLFRLVGAFFDGFNRLFDKLSNFYGATVARLVRMAFIMLVVYGGLIL